MPLADRVRPAAQISAADSVVVLDLNEKNVRAVVVVKVEAGSCVIGVHAHQIGERPWLADVVPPATERPPGRIVPIQRRRRSDCEVSGRGAAGAVGHQADV